MTQRKKKTIEYHFVDMNDPDRYKKLKVGRACDFCRRRKSKCDIGVPGSGTCSNCKKSNQTCNFSPVQPTNQTYRDKFPFFSMDEKAHCGYERDNIYAHATFNTREYEEPVFSKQSDQELFDIYFGHVHPFFPILDKHAFQLDTLPLAQAWAIMAVASCHFTQDNANAGYYYNKAVDTLDHQPSLSTVQTLLLLYKYGEIVTPVGTPISSLTIGYLKEAQSILTQFNSTHHGSRQDEFRIRAQWIIYITLTFGNIADKRWREALDDCILPTKKPELTEIEHYDQQELINTCNLIQLVQLALIYSPLVCFMSDQRTLFSNKQHDFLPQFLNYATLLENWKSALPPSLSHNLFTNHLYMVQDQSSSFTTYLCLIHDIISLLINIHQPSQHAHLSRLALAVCYRTHCLTVGDLAPSTFSRVASIQGSRLVAFALTLVLQTQAYCDEHKLSTESKKNYELCCDLAFQIFDQVTLSPQFYMTIQVLRTQRESELAVAVASAALLNTPHRVQERPNYSTQSSYSSHESTYTSSEYSYYSNTPLVPSQTNSSTGQTQTQSISGDWQGYQQYSLSNWLEPTHYDGIKDTMPTTPPLWLKFGCGKLSCKM